MNNQTYFIFHRDDPISQQSVENLPSDYNRNVNIHYVGDDIADHVPQSVSTTIRLKQLNSLNSNAPNTNSNNSPSVLFYDHKTQNYIHHEGTKAIQFIHNFSSQKKDLQLKQQSRVFQQNSEKMQSNHSNLKKVLEMAVKKEKIKTHAEPMFRTLVESNTKLQLSKIYTKLHNQIHRTAPEHGYKHNA
jgi:hypothetical protein